MQRFISYGSIPQFRQTVKDITFAAQYTHYDEVGQHPVTDTTIKLPTLTFVGTEKIHGTNAAVCYSNPDGFWVQSRKKIITPGKDTDNAGCAEVAYSYKAAWRNIIDQLATEHNINLDTHIISVYYEWAGGNIQKKSALTGLDKRAMIFRSFKVSPIQPVLDAEGSEDQSSYTWKESYTYSDFGAPTPDLDWASTHEAGIYNIMDYPIVTVDINFGEPLMSQSKMIEMVEKLEANSTVGQAFGINGNIGEGYVFEATYKGKLYKFKAKGEEHAKHSGKVKTLAPVDEEAEKAKNDFVNNIACIHWRLEQMFNETEQEAGTIDRGQTGTYLQKVFADVIKEESDIMEELGFNFKALQSKIAKVAKSYFNSRII